MRRRTMRTAILVMVLLPVTGCAMTSAERVELVDKAVAYLQAESAKFDVRIQTLDAVIAASQAALKEPNVTGDAAGKIDAALTQAREELAKVKPAKEKVDLVLADLQAKLAGLKAGGAIDVAAELTAAAQVLGTVGGVVGGPVGGWLQAIAAIVIAILSAAPGLLVARKRGTDLAAASTALKEVVAGGEKFKEDAAAASAPVTVVGWKTAMAAEQRSPKTKELVALARASLA